MTRREVIYLTKGELEDTPAVELARLLTAGYSLEYNEKKLHQYDDDLGPYVITGTDSYGLDFCAGDLSAPASLKESLLSSTRNELIQEGELAVQYDLPKYSDSDYPF